MATTSLPLFGGDEPSYAELLCVYRRYVDPTADLSVAIATFNGKFPSPRHWAEYALESSDGLHHVTVNLRNYVDFERYARDAAAKGDITFAWHNGVMWAFTS